MEAEGLAAGKKNAARLGAHIVFVDESGFLLIPLVMRTWAPRGQTPIHRHRYRRDKVSVIGGISVSPTRRRVGHYFRLYLHNIRHEEVCEFLRHLLRHLRGHVIAILDNSRTHRGEPLRALRRRIPRLHLEYFPPYAPEINPEEGVWSLAKRGLANGRPDAVETLYLDLTKFLGNLAHSPDKFRACIRQSDLPSFLP